MRLRCCRWSTRSSSCRSSTPSSSACARGRPPATRCAGPRRRSSTPRRGRRGSSSRARASPSRRATPTRTRVPARNPPGAELRVLIVLHSAQRGGANDVVLALLRHRPPDVDAAVVFLAGGPDEEEARALGVPVAVVAAGRAREAWRAPATIRRLRGAIRRHRADVVFSHVAKAHLYAAPAARLEQLPVVWWQHEWAGHAPRMQALAARLGADAIICSSEHTAADQRARSRGVPVETVHP